MNPTPFVAVALMCVLASTALLAQESTPRETTQEEFEAKLGYQTGTVTLPGDTATIQLPASFRFVGPEGSKRILTTGWGNPAENAEGVLGMLIPTSVSPLDPDGWGIVITFEEDGYVNDDDAAGINYTKMLKEMQTTMDEVNEERRKEGLETVKIVGWAEPPHYDSAAHKLYWAKELEFGNNPDHTLNYNIRILGRRGILVLNAVASMNQLQAIRTESKSILPAIEFNAGHKYADYVPGKDKLASYGVGALIVGTAGTLAAKAGFFKLLWIGILASKKLVIVGAIALFALVGRLFAKRPKKETRRRSLTKTAK